MLYDGRGDYIRRYEPQKIPSPGIAVWLTLLLISVALVWASGESYQCFEPDQIFQQVFSSG
jgi:hypothetical protein